ncbi:glycerol-3-phosphate acyltransferase 1, mitochondrial-like [Argonauta hians]
MDTISEQSRNSWIKKDNRKNISERHKDMYEDVLDDRRSSSDFRWATRTREDVPTYSFCKTRSPADIKKDVLNSKRVQYVIERLSEESGSTTAELTSQAAVILDEMAHNINMSSIRGFAFFLVKVLKQLFSHIYVNEDGIQQVRNQLKDYPVLLMPSHRSYLDFLLLSFIFFHYDLPLPAIAAAMDFMSMNFFGWLLRNCGAFYIQRSFGANQLYWAVFTQYVQTQIANGDRPLEFFPEGTRSRTAKSLCPKYGLLSAALESYFKGTVSDIKIIPISISYSRILEEKLYAYELLGVPKPKESTYGLFQARGVLSEDYGNIHVHIGDPISVSSFSENIIHREVHNLLPRYISNVSLDEQKLIMQLSYQVILNQQKYFVVSPWSMIAAVLMQNKEGISFKQLVKQVEWLKRQASNLGAYIDWPGHEPEESVIQDNMLIHKKLVSVRNSDIVEITVLNNMSDDLMVNAAHYLMIASYRNQLTHIFVRVAMIALPVNACSKDTLSLDSLYQSYSFLEKLFSRDFIFLPGNTKQDFEQALLVLEHTCGVVLEEGNILIKPSTNKYTVFFSHMFEPFLIGYWVLCQHLLSMPQVGHGKLLAKPIQMLAKEAQMVAARLLREQLIKHPEILSLNLLNNGLMTLFNMGALHKEKRNGSVYMSPNTVVLTKVTENIAQLIEVPTVPVASINLDTKTVVVNAKL